jgi:hypothetical protein
MTDRRAQFLQNFIMAQRPGVVDFLRQNIVIPRSMSPARMQTATAPFSLDHQGFAKFILECADPSRGITDVTTCSATQVFKTFGLLMMLVYRIVNVPSPKLIVFPTKDTAQKAVSRKKLQPLINANPILAERKPANKDHFTDMEMDMRGGAIRLTGTGSATNLASTSEQDILQDECCKFEHHISEDAPEAHPMDLADERAKSFGPDAWRYKSSSPNIVTHPFWIRYEAGSQTHFMVSCPNCRHHFPFEDWPDKTHDEKHPGYEKVGPDYQSLVWTPDARDARGQWDEQKMRETIRYICPSCEYPIREEERLGMLNEVEPIDLNPVAATRNKSFRLPSFYSPALTFGDVAWNRIKPSDLFDNHQNHQNSWLANCWQQITASIKTEDVRKLRDVSDYRRGFIPRSPMGLFIAADVGDYKTHYVVGAVFDNDEIAAIDWGTVLTIEDLQGLRTLKYPVVNSSEVIQVSCGFVDSADQTIRVYDMCQASRGFWFPASGSDVNSGSWGFTPLKTHQLERYTFNSFKFKKEFYVNLIKEQKAPRFFIPKDADEDFMDGLSGQQLITVRGKEEFKKIPHDHYGDCCLRLLLARVVERARRGHGAPDLPAEPEPSGRDYTLHPPA